MQAAGCAVPPAHTLPGPPPAVTHVPVPPAHAFDDVEVDAYPGEQEHATGCAAPPAHALPTTHAMQDPLPAAPLHATVVVDTL